MERTPPNTSLISGSGSVGGSVPNLSTFGYDEENEEVQINTISRKRKDRSHEHDYRKDLLEFRSEIMNFLQEFGKTQIEHLNQIRQEITEVKEEIQIVKSVTNNLTDNMNKICCEIQAIQSENTKTQDRIAIIESDITVIKTKQQSSFPSTGNPALNLPFSNDEDIISELKDRSDREKNIIIVGIKETNDKNSAIRRKYDDDMVTKITTMVYENCPKPINLMRLGKYNPEKNRPVKVCFDNNYTPKQLLRNKSKLPDNILIYSDQTPAQKNYLQSLKEELKERENSGEYDLSIKYIKNKHKIIKTKN